MLKVAEHYPANAPAPELIGKDFEAWVSNQLSLAVDDLSKKGFNPKSETMAASILNLLLTKLSDRRKNLSSSRDNAEGSEYRHSLGILLLDTEIKAITQRLRSPCPMSETALVERIKLRGTARDQFFTI